MANYEALRESVNKNGEVMIRLDTGESIELHIHNVKFVDRYKGNSGRFWYSNILDWR